MSDLIVRLRKAAQELRDAHAAWAQTVEIPTLGAAQQRTIDLLCEAAAALTAQETPREHNCECEMACTICGRFMADYSAARSRPATTGTNDGYQPKGESR